MTQTIGPEQQAAIDARAVADENLKTAGKDTAQAVSFKFKSEQVRDAAAVTRNFCEMHPGHQANTDYQAGVTTQAQGEVNHAHGQTLWLTASQYYAGGVEAYNQAIQHYGNGEWLMAETFWTVAASNFGSASEKALPSASYFLLARFKFQAALDSFQAALTTLQAPTMPDM